MQTASDRKWLVKSENKILGPYSFDQLEDLLKKKQISLIDEVRDMNTRWMYIREAESLKAIVDVIRDELAKVDDHTKTFQTRTAQGVTKTGTITKELVQAENTKFQLPTFTDVKVDDVEFTETPTPKQKSQQPKAPPQNSAPKYVSSADPQVRTQIKESSKTTLVILGSILLGFLVAAGAFYFYELQSKRKHEQHGMAAIRRYNTFGLDNKVLEIFGGLNPESQRQIISDIIPMIPKLDAVGYINGAQTISNLKADPQIDDQKKALLDVIDFIQALQDQNLKKARESLIRAKDLDPTNVLIKEDDAILNFYEGKFDAASKLFQELFKDNSKGRLLLGWALSELAKPTNDSAVDAKLIGQIDRYTFINLDFKKELTMINMLLNKRNNKELGFVDSYNTFVDTPVNLRHQFQIPPAVFSGLYSMFSLRNVFEKLKVLLSPAQKFTVETHFKIEMGEVSAAHSMYTSFNNMIENVDDRGNLRILVDMGLKNYNSVIAQESMINDAKLNTASHYALLSAKLKNNLPESELSKHINFLRKEKNLLSLWAQLQMINDPAKKMAFVQLNSTTGADFIPFQEVKGSGE